MINFDKPIPGPVEDDVTDWFISQLEAENIRVIRVQPVWYTTDVTGERISHEMKTRLADDIQYIIDQLIDTKPEIVYVREVVKTTLVPGIAHGITYRVRIDALYVEAA